MASSANDDTVRAIKEALGERTIVLVGLMGAGKSSVGRRLAIRLGLPFVDADNEIETAAGMTIAEIFEMHGEAYFRSGEERVVARILDSGPKVLATGGGAYMREATRKMIAERGISVWLKAEFDVLMKRVRRRADRPLLKNDNPEAVMRTLMDERYPVYAEADLTVMSADIAHEAVVDQVVAALAGYLLPPAETAVGSADDKGVEP
ncbi:MAG: shikimate kinase [Alphaproteobacteria bacterium]